MVHLGYSDDKGLLSRERKNTRVDDLDEFYAYSDPSLFGQSYEPFFSSFPPQGRFAAGGYVFTYGNNGALQPCFTTNGPTCDSQVTNSKGVITTPRLVGVNGGFGTGPNGFNRQFYRTLSTPVKRWLFAEQAHYDITDNITFISEATYAKTIAKSEIE